MPVLPALEGVQAIRIDPLTGIADQNLANLFPAHRVAVGTPGRHRLAKIGNSQDARRPRDFVPGQTTVVTAAVESLVMRAGDVGQSLESVDAFENSLREFGMPADLAEFVF